jgi:hypothetical protein
MSFLLDENAYIDERQQELLETITSEQLKEALSTLCEEFDASLQANSVLKKVSKNINSAHLELYFY